MGLTVKVNGVDVSALVDVQTLVITQVLTRRGDTASFALLDPSLARSFAPLQAVTIVDELGNAKFGGVATRLRQTVADGPGLNRWRLECQDATYYLLKTLCNKKYQAQSIDQIVKDLLASFPPGVAITTNNVQAGLPTLQYFNAPHLRLADAFDKLVRLSDSTAFLMWDLDANNDLHFFDQNHAPAADIVLTDTPPVTGAVNYRRDSFWYERDVSQFANQITFRGGTFLSNPYLQTWVGNGKQSSYLCDYPPDSSVPAGGALPTVTVSGVAQTVALDSGNGFGSAAALLSLAQDTQNATLRFAVAPAAGATISATYVYDLPVLVRRKDNVSVTTYGTWEEYVTDGQVKTQQAATQRAAAMLSQFARPLATASVDVDQTYRGSLAAGQQVTMINTQLGLNTSMLITDCRISGMPGGHYQHRLRLAAFA
ncbi:MAG TPA: hypothetical protein VGP33_16445 [Chloroflexota bacterium]|nr:hypothetical protein [Chloroflexota bacterium]